MNSSTMMRKLRNISGLLRLYVALLWAHRRSHAAPFVRKSSPWGEGISVLIPECNTPDLLAATLVHAEQAIAQVPEPTEIIVQVNGAPAGLYVSLQYQHPGVVWRFEEKALGFNNAIEAGLQAVRFPAVYLLNSDMRLAADALVQLLAYRSPSTFALASQIFFSDPSRRREETGWSDYHVKGARTVVYEKEPGTSKVARGSLYAGGGSSLFRTALLQEYVVASRAYSPFYWEDADWGVRAWAEGMECIFVPGSTAVHEHRGTIGRSYSTAAIDRIVDRNALLFELRHHFTDLDGWRAIRHIAAQPQATKDVLYQSGVASGIAAMRAQNDAVKARGFRFSDIPDKYYGRAWRPDLPTVLWVSPFAVYPPSHGGARRISELAQRIGEKVNLVLLSDEALNYAGCLTADLGWFHAVHLLQARQDVAGQTSQPLALRMLEHAPQAMRQELQRLQSRYRIDLVQVEFMEAARLVEERLGNIPFVASLHDVYVDGGQQDAMQLGLLRQFQAVVVCSGEDAAMLGDLPQRHLIANGASDRYGQCVPSPPCQSILFMGPFRYAPNYTGILGFLAHVWPALRSLHPSVELVILGGAESAAPRFDHALLRQPGIRLISEFVDPVPWLAASTLTINPQQEICGSALKVAESLLARRICVSTRQGARGFSGMATTALRICDTWTAMVNEIDCLLGNPSLRHQLEQSNEQVRLGLSWDGKARELLALYQKLLPGKIGAGKIA